jgi:hypothetical protein
MYRVLPSSFMYAHFAGDGFRFAVMCGL